MPKSLFCDLFSINPTSTAFILLATSLMPGMNIKTALAEETLTLPALPEPVSNNAVAKVHLKGQDYLLSFMGLGAGKTYKDVHNKAWVLNLKYPRNGWRKIQAVPYINPLPGRLAAVAVGIKHRAYVFGGYTVGKDHSEISTQDNYLYRLENDSYERIADMPVAVDDAALVTYQDRYIYLISGWHQHGNINLVQVYDTELNTWSQASPLPAPGVFGQAAGIVGNELVICDGVKVLPQLDQKRTFAPSPICLYGKIQPDNHLRIDWQALPHYSVEHNQEAISAEPTSVETTYVEITPIKPKTPTQAVAHYRMATTGLATTKQIVFVGGSDNPYNYNGIGYDGDPCSPSNQVYRFDLTSHTWLEPMTVNQASMDHRGLIEHKGYLIRVGGMIEGQEVSNKVIADLPPKAPIEAIADSSR